MTVVPQITEHDLIQIHRDLCAGSLLDFVRYAWPVLEPSTPYLEGWHMGAVCDHLEAIASGEINRLLINIPPGTSKSSLASVYFPAWLWGPGRKKHWRIIGASHEASLATRDNRRTRLLVESDWYQARWDTPITSDQNEKTYFENAATGFRQSCAVRSMTGKRGHVVIWDDPQNTEAANSELERETAKRVFRETLPSRLVDPSKSAIIVIMQRLHEADVAGHILSGDYGYEHLMLPMEFEPLRRCRTSIGFVDPRTEPGELLQPERFTREVVERDKKVMGSYATAGQFQQRPVPREGALILREWLNLVDAVPAGTKWVRGWDLAASTEPGSAYTAAVKLGKTPAGRFIVGHVLRKRMTAGNVERAVTATAKADGEDVRGSLPQDPGAGGKAWAQALIRAAAGYPYRATPESGDKVTRAQAFAAQCEAGNVDVLRAGWTEDYIDEITIFPGGTYADQMDATSRAFTVLTAQPKLQWYVDGEVVEQ